MRRKMLFMLLACLLISAACLTVGRDFPTEGVAEIQIGRTTKTELLGMFGPPYQKGLEDGQETWTYVWVRRGPTKALSRELHIKFDKQGKVETYSFSTTEP